MGFIADVCLGFDLVRHSLNPRLLINFFGNHYTNTPAADSRVGCRRQGVSSQGLIFQNLLRVLRIER